MQIQQEENDGQGAFFILDGQQRIAELTYYFVNEDTINANHTYVDETLRGQGVADKLYQALIRFVRENRLNLMATCSYVAKKWARDNGQD